MIYMIVGGIWLAGLALVLVFNYGAHRNDDVDPFDYEVDKLIEEQRFDILRRESEWRR